MNLIKQNIFIDWCNSVQLGCRMVGILKEKELIVIFKVNVIDILSINIYINCHMIFGDEETFQQQLFADIDSLLKIIKCE